MCITFLGLTNHGPLAFQFFILPNPATPNPPPTYRHPACTSWNIMNVTFFIIT